MVRGLLILCLHLMLLMPLSGCAPKLMGAGENGPAGGYLSDRDYVTADGVHLPVEIWPVHDPKAVVIALHGFNDYRRFFSAAAEYLQGRQIASYAYDQRGFGATANAGIWAGSETYADDLLQFSRLIRAKHPKVPLFLLGESMGGAIVVHSMARAVKPDVAGIVLSAPAVWGRQTMPWYQTSLLWSLSYTVPWLTLTGKGLNILPSDNIDMLRALGRDPLVIKQTRVDAIHGLTDLMDAALAEADKVQANTLLLYGEKDQVVPVEPTRLFVNQMLVGHPGDKTIGYYRDGYHMLLRDLQAPVVWQDIAHWVLSAKAPLPSGADSYAASEGFMAAIGKAVEPGPVSESD